MGTNYYHVTDPCECCGRSDPRAHIGKSSGGWTFSFHGGYEEDGTAGIVSWKDWQRVLQERGHIENEYGETIPFAEFAELVESKRTAHQNHTLYCRVHHPEHAHRDCWLDEDGHSFSRGTFS